MNLIADAVIESIVKGLEMHTSDRKITPITVGIRISNLLPEGHNYVEIKGYLDENGSKSTYTDPLASSGFAKAIEECSVGEEIKVRILNANELKVAYIEPLKGRKKK